MIVNLERFIATERLQWERLEAILVTLADDPWRELSLEDARELERLYQRASADLARIATFSAEPETRRYLENLVARAYAQVHGAREEGSRFRPWRWLRITLPQTFRRQAKAFAFATALLLLGALFGGLAVAFDPEAKEVLMPFPHLLGDPKERVAMEEKDQGADLEGGKAQFSGMLMTHNTKVTLLALALGMTWGVGTLVIVFSNGVMLGAVIVDYVRAGESTFLMGWLLPHGIIEIPAILVGAQAGFVLASALIGRGQKEGLGLRMRKIGPDVMTLAFGAALMLVWAGMVEAFISQYHQPVLPYSVKIAFGLVEGGLFVLYLSACGREGRRKAA